MSKDRVFFLILWIVVFIPFSAPAAAQPSVEIDLTRETRREVSIAIPKFIPDEKSPYTTQLSKKARQILENDIKLSELFLQVEPAVYERLADLEIDTPKIDYQAWVELGAQWVVKAQLKWVAESKTVIIVFRLYDAQNKKFLMGKRYRANPSFLRKMIHRFADEAVAHLTGKPGLAGTRIAFASGKGGKKEVYVVDFDGHNVVKLTDDQSLAISPAWSPNGQRIVFTSYVSNNPDLVMIDLHHNKRWTILKLPGLNTAPSWSPDGDNIALVLSKDGNSEIYLLNKNSKLKRLTHYFDIDTSPTWSPDAKKIAFTSNRSGIGSPQIYIMDATGDEGVVKRISFNSSYNDSPAWSPDGDKIAYVSRIGKRFQIKIYNVETATTEDFTSGAGTKEEPSWSPDGRFLAYRHTDDEGKQTYIKRVGSNKTRLLINLPDGGYNPAWSPYLK